MGFSGHYNVNGIWNLPQAKYWVHGLSRKAFQREAPNRRASKERGGKYGLWFRV